MLLAVQVPSNLKYGCQVDLAQDELPARQRCSLRKDEAGGCHLA